MINFANLLAKFTDFWSVTDWKLTVVGFETQNLAGGGANSSALCLLQFEAFRTASYTGSENESRNIQVHSRERLGSAMLIQPS